MIGPTKIRGWLGTFGYSAAAVGIAYVTAEILPINRFTRIWLKHPFYPVFQAAAMTTMVILLTFLLHTQLNDRTEKRFVPLMSLVFGVMGSVVGYFVAVLLLEDPTSRLLKMWGSPAQSLAILGRTVLVSLSWLVGLLAGVYVLALERIYRRISRPS